MSNGLRTSGLPVILASASPRRKDLLSRLGYPFEILPSRIQETERPGENPHTHVRRLAQEKACDVASGRPEALVIGMDTVVVLDRDMLGKPASPAQARETLGRLSGRTHEVLTGVALVRPVRPPVVRVACTRVHFKALDADEIDRYVATGEPMDKAGAYGIQDSAGLFVTGIEGCFYNVVGLPLNLLYETLRGLGLLR